MTAVVRLDTMGNRCAIPPWPRPPSADGFDQLRAILDALPPTSPADARLTEAAGLIERAAGVA